MTRSERCESAAYLRGLLEDGPVNATTVLEQSRKFGFSEITLRRAYKDLAIRSFREPRFGGVCLWCLPGDEDKVVPWGEKIDEFMTPLITDVSWYNAYDLVKTIPSEDIQREAAEYFWSLAQIDIPGTTS